MWCVWQGRWWGALVRNVCGEYGEGGEVCGCVYGCGMCVYNVCGICMYDMWVCIFVNVMCVWCVYGVWGIVLGMCGIWGF